MQGLQAEVGHPRCAGGLSRMDAIVTGQRKWSRAEMAELLIARNALTDLKLGTDPAWRG